MHSPPASAGWFLSHSLATVVDLVHDRPLASLEVVGGLLLSEGVSKDFHLVASTL